MLAAKKKKETEDIYIPSLDATITIEEPDGTLVRDANEMEAGEGDKYLCYECIIEPRLKAKDVQDAFGCNVPMDICDILFKPGEIPQIAVAIMKLAGYGGGVEAIKN
jgi:hypothetical protein